MADLIRVGQREGIIPASTGVPTTPIASPLAAVGNVVQEFEEINLRKQALKFNAWADEMYSNSVADLYRFAEGLDDELLLDEKEYKERFDERKDEIISGLDDRVTDRFGGRITRLSDAILSQGLRNVETRRTEHHLKKKKDNQQTFIRQAITADDPTIPLELLSQSNARAVAAGLMTEADSKEELDQMTDGIFYNRLLDEIEATPLNEMDALKEDFDSGDAFPIKDPDLFAKARRAIDQAEPRKRQEESEEFRKQFTDILIKANGSEDFKSLMNMVQDKREILSGAVYQGLLLDLQTQMDLFVQKNENRFLMEAINNGQLFISPNDPGHIKNFNNYYNDISQQQDESLQEEQDPAVQLEMVKQNLQTNVQMMKRHGILPDKVKFDLDRLMMNPDGTEQDLLFAGELFDILNASIPGQVSKVNYPSFDYLRYMNYHKTFQEKQKAAREIFLARRIYLDDQATREQLSKRANTQEFQTRINDALDDHLGDSTVLKAKLFPRVKSMFELGLQSVDSNPEKAINVMLESMNDSPFGINDSTISASGTSYKMEATPETVIENADPTIIRNMFLEDLRGFGVDTKRFEQERPSIPLAFQPIGLVGIEGAAEFLGLPVEDYRLLATQDSLITHEWLIEGKNEQTNGNWEIISRWQFDAKEYDKRFKEFQIQTEAQQKEAEELLQIQKEERRRIKKLEEDLRKNLLFGFGIQ